MEVRGVEVLVSIGSITETQRKFIDDWMQHIQISL